MSFKFLFVVLCALTLRTRYEIDAVLLWYVASWGKGFRRWSADLWSILLFIAVVGVAMRYMEWRYWHPVFVWPGLLEASQGFRNFLAEAIETRATGSLERFLQAVLLGDKRGISQVDARAFQRWGISHMLAVSGFHVGLWVGASTLLFRGLLRMAWMRLPVLLLQSGFLVLYCLSVGAGPSVVRAVGTFIAVRWATLNKASFKAMHWPFAVGVGAWLCYPPVVLQLGFQLSYLAVLALLWSMGPGEEAHFFNSFTLERTKTSRWFNALVLPAQISMAAWGATLPLVQFSFGGASPWFLLGNVLVVPVYVVYIWSALVLLFVPWVPDELLAFWNASFEAWHHCACSTVFLMVNFRGFTP